MKKLTRQQITNALQYQHNEIEKLKKDVFDLKFITNSNEKIKKLTGKVKTYVNSN